MERIPVTHAGSLIRPTQLLAYLSAIDHGRATEGADYRAALGAAVDYVVRKQVETGIDLIDQAESRGAATWVCTGPMSYDKTALDRDLTNFKVALDANGKDITETFLPVVAPASAYSAAGQPQARARVEDLPRCSAARGPRW
jgi:hypothetical protein